MPNGGSDCCGTCHFRTPNDGKPETTKRIKCSIRELDIPKPFWTYCANHPHHNKKNVDVPLGPVYICDSYPYSRKIWQHPPDTELIRNKLLELLGNIDELVTITYHSDTHLEEEVIKQVQALKEKRALPELLRITQLTLEPYSPDLSFLSQYKVTIVGQAIEVLLDISEGEYLEQVKHFIDYGLDKNEIDKPQQDPFAAIRYHLIRGFEYCTQPEVRPLLQQGSKDPHDEVKSFALEILNKRNLL